MNKRILAAAAVIALAVSALRAAESEFPGSVPVLLANQSVRSDLALTKSQCASLDAIRADYRSDARLVTARFPDSTVGKKAANETVRQLTAQANACALKVLTPAQRERLDQIGHQKLGALMLLLPRVREKLSLSKDQIASLDRFRADGEAFAAKVNASFEDGRIGLDERLDTLRAWRETQSKKILRTLSADQKKQLEKMRGQAVKPS